MKPLPRIVPCSDRSLLVVFGEEIAVEANRNVLRLTRLLLGRCEPPLLNVHPGYSSVLVSFDPAAIAPAVLARDLEKCLASLAGVALPEPRTVVVPVCYEGDPSSTGRARRSCRPRATGGRWEARRTWS